MIRLSKRDRDPRPVMTEKNAENCNRAVDARLKINREPPNDRVEEKPLLTVGWTLGYSVAAS
jgi:hypothetical protein